MERSASPEPKNKAPASFDEFKKRVDGFEEVDVDAVFKSNKYQQLPAIKVKPLKHSNVIELFGPDPQASPESSGSYAYCRSISTYPRQAVKGKSKDDGVKGVRLGDPICDCFGIQLYENRTICAVADGCNWGEEPREAARLACRTFLEYLKNKSDQILTLREAGHFLLRAFAHAHSSILQSPRSARDVYASGTTTLLGGLLLELAEEEATKYGHPWVFVCASVGDCKAFLYSPHSSKATDATRGNRPQSNDVRDPGGRLGPYIGPKGGPDLRNLGLFMLPCEDKSLLFVLTDGIHDNLDPEHLGLSPRDVDLDQDSWDTPLDLIEKVKDRFRTKCLVRKIAGDYGEKFVTPETAATRLLRHCKVTTRHSRRWLQENPARRLPTDPKKFRGKMDHATCIVTTVEARNFMAQSVGGARRISKSNEKLRKEVLEGVLGALADTDAVRDIQGREGEDFHPRPHDDHSGTAGGKLQLAAGASGAAHKRERPRGVRDSDPRHPVRRPAREDGQPHHPASHNGRALQGSRGDGAIGPSEEQRDGVEKESGEHKRKPAKQEEEEGGEDVDDEEGLVVKEAKAGPSERAEEAAFQMARSEGEQQRQSPAVPALHSASASPSYGMQICVAESADAVLVYARAANGGEAIRCRAQELSVELSLEPVALPPTLPNGFCAVGEDELRTLHIRQVQLPCPVIPSTKERIVVDANTAGFLLSKASVFTAAPSTKEEGGAL